MPRAKRRRSAWSARTRRGAGPYGGQPVFPEVQAHESDSNDPEPRSREDTGPVESVRGRLAACWRAEIPLAAFSHYPGERLDALARCPSTEVIEATMAVRDDDADVYLGRCEHHLETGTGRTTPSGE